MSTMRVETGPCFRVYILGPAWIEWGGEPLTILRRQARGLVYRLAAHMQPVSREELCFAFWPDMPERTAHRHLSHVLCHLRECLPMPTLVRSHNELVELDPRQAWSDTCAFEAACALPDSGDLTALEHGLDHYRGPFLSGFSLPDAPEFESWMAQQRSAFQRLYLDGLAMLISAEADRTDAGGKARAVRFARQYLKVDNLAEGVHRQLMALYAAMGDRRAALQQYQECAAALERRLGVKPLPETRAVYEAILQT